MFFHLISTRIIDYIFNKILNLGLYPGHVLSPVLEGPSAHVWPPEEPGKAGGRGRVYQPDLDAGHLLCQREDCVLPQGDDGEPVP